MCGYHCPFSERKPCAGFLLCRDIFKEGVNYNIRDNAMNVICAFQKQCMKTGRMENTDSAKECYRMHMQAKQPKAAEITKATEILQEEKPDETSAEPKTTKTKKKN